MTLTKSISCIELPSYDQPKPVDKRVRWSIELEEVRYYKPTRNNTASKNIGKKLQTVKRKASVLAERAATGFASIPNELSTLLRSRSSSYEISDAAINASKHEKDFLLQFRGIFEFLAVSVKCLLRFHLTTPKRVENMNTHKLSWKDLQLIFSKDKNMAKHVKWADKLEEIRYFIKENDRHFECAMCEKCNNEVEGKNKRNRQTTAKKPSKINEQPEEKTPESIPNLTKEMVRLALCKNNESNAEKNWKKLFKLVSSAVLDDRINDIMRSEWV
ncbi:hypothetical protein AC249_AIPGENE11690 [Exaiptasia diaphana]|nr:hypothetical protein AC249_AIPGENE11690 [Exaiptasia diaphana]